MATSNVENHSTLLTPKAQELVANPYRHQGKDGAKEFFVDGFNQVFARIRETAITTVPMTVYYAYKQQDATSGTSNGWYALLDGLIRSGWEITATLPVRSELSNRMLAKGTNALASSIVLACWPRPAGASAITMRAFTGLLHGELTEQLKTIISSGIDPVDLAQAAIGPGISVYSRYSCIRKADGTDMGIQEALELINRTLSEVLEGSEADYDPDTRFAIQWYRSYGWSQQNSGQADQLSRSVGTSPAELVHGGIFEAAAGKARLLKPTELEGDWEPLNDDRISIWEALVRLAGILQQKGVAAASKSMSEVGERLAIEEVKNLSFQMFHEAEKRKDAEGARAFNGLVSVWNDLSAKSERTSAHRAQRLENTQGSLDI